MEDDEKYNFKLVEISSEKGAIDIVNSVITDKKYLDWKQRVPLFFRKYKNHWIFKKIINKENNVIGFVIISFSHKKREQWNAKFLLNDWIKKSIEDNFIQFAFFYIHHEERGRGYGSNVIEAIKHKYRGLGYKKLYGFSRYPAVVYLYQKTGAKIINQSKQGSEIWTYYYWDL